MFKIGFFLAALSGVLIASLLSRIERLPPSAYADIPEEMAAPLLNIVSNVLGELALTAPITDATLSATRAFAYLRYETALPPPFPQPVERLVAGGAPDEPPVRIYLFDPAPASPSPPASLRAAFLHMHGGGFVLGHPLEFVTRLQVRSN